MKALKARLINAAQVRSVMASQFNDLTPHPAIRGHSGRKLRLSVAVPLILAILEIPEG